VLPNLVGHPGDIAGSREVMDFLGPGLEGLCFFRGEGIADDEEAVVFERGDLGFWKLGSTVRHDGSS
jgi:hypothetical protein